MAKKVAVLAVNPVNGFGLFQYLESFFENGITYKVKHSLYQPPASTLYKRKAYIILHSSQKRQDK